MRVWAGVLVVSACFAGCTGLNPSYQTQLEDEVGIDDDVEPMAEPGGSTGSNPTTGAGGGSGEDDEPGTTGGDAGASTGEGHAESSGDDGSSTGEPDETGAVDVEPPHLVYLAYEGVFLTAGLDDARANVSQFTSGEFAEFQTPEMMEDVVAELEVAWEGINVEFRLERPMDGEYTMVVISPTNPFGGALGVAPGDCENLNPNSVAFVFTNSGYTPESIAGVASRELGFTYGLEQVEHPNDFMRNMPGVGSGFFDDCSSLIAGSVCEHTDGCGPSQQNSFFELQERLGAI